MDIKKKWSKIGFIGWVAFTSCTNNNLEIKPISDFNQQLLKREGIDPALLDSREVFQYYQIANEADVNADEMKAKLLTFVHKQYSAKQLRQAKNLTLFFYKGSALQNHRLVYQAVTESADGSLLGQKDNLRARIAFQVLNTDTSRCEQTIWMYPKKENSTLQKDTIDIH